MRRRIILIIFFAVIKSALYAQSTAGKVRIDSLKHELAIAKTDTACILVMISLCNAYEHYNLDSVAFYGKNGLALAQKIGYSKGEFGILDAWQSALEQHGDLPQSLELNFKALQIAEDKRYPSETAFAFSNIGSDYWDLQDYLKAINYYKKALSVSNAVPYTSDVQFMRITSELSMGDSYSEINQLDSAFFYVEKVYKATLNDPYWHRASLLYLGDVLFKMGNHKRAFACLRQSIMLNEKVNDNYNGADACKTIARFFKETNQPDSAIFYAKKGLAHAQIMGFRMDILINSQILADEYEHKDAGQALYYLKLAMATNEGLFGSKKVKELQKILSEEQQRQREIELQRITRQNQLKQYIYLAGLAALLLIAFILYYHDKQKQKVNKVLEATLTNLKSTQTQLIQSAKMASLGELTAGIAHEIQNPLNFVNNFSEVSLELMEELKEELDKGETEEAKVITSDVIENLGKINHHGKRAGGIVKGMLEHSRTSTGERRATNINVLADEFFKLSFHGLSAKDKSFNAEMVTNFDKNLPQINIVQQDIGRVLLNLFNNAFYAVNQKMKTTEQDYKPEVTVSTALQNGQVIIKVKDNGNGIPDTIKDKIMQPFFTTKPTGEGTGLGLSLSYDIVVKGHGGSITVDTKEGEFTEFTVKLPIQP